MPEGSSTDRTRVAVLGGGVGGITTAFELTATPALRERFEVTVYTLGWRLGGKGASGRNLGDGRGHRIEEHGLHIWFGFYDNAFRMMRDAYEELGRPADKPLATLEDAFRPCDQIVLHDQQDGEWVAFPCTWPRNFLRPGDGVMPTFWDIAKTLVKWALGRWREFSDGIDFGNLGGLSPIDFTPDWFDRELNRMGAVVNWVADASADHLLAGADHLLELAAEIASRRAAQTSPANPNHYARDPSLFATPVRRFRDFVWLVAEDRIRQDPDLRLFFTMLDVFASTTAGIVEDGVLAYGFDAVNDYEWCEWLESHGAKDVTIGADPATRAPLLRAVYDVAFGYRDGDIAKADLAAGTATSDMLRLLFSYRGAIAYKMQAGMGDAVFTPFYEVLRRRGVRFQFFHGVTHIGVSADGRYVDSVAVVPQVDFKSTSYEPLVEVNDLECWPSEPLWDQIVDGDELRDQGVDFEREVNPLHNASFRLRHGTDFDKVVLAIPVGALAGTCADLMESNEAFEQMVKTAATVPTQAFQLWMRKSATQLGWQHREDSVTGCYVEPLDTYCDMTHLVGREKWADGDEVLSVAYFCGVLDDRPGETAAEATARVKLNALEFLKNDVAPLWPAAVSGNPGALRWELLCAHDGSAGESRFDSQYWRANTSPGDRYVMTPAGTVKHRLAPDRSGFENLVLAGDWTKTGIDGGCVEAAAVSGAQAARALIGHDRPITGEDTRWLTPK